MNQKFKYTSGQILYYVDPFIFTIHLLQIDYIFEDYTGKYYMSGEAYLQEWDLFLYLDDAKSEAIKRLKKFYEKKEGEILHTDPKRIVEEENGNDFSNE